MDKNLTVRQSSEVEAVREKHSLFPHTRAGWMITGITTIGASIVCAIGHFDGGTVLGGLFVVGTAAGFSDDVVHAVLYGKRFPGHLVTRKPVNEQFQALASDFAERWLGFERDDNPRNSFKARMARMCGMPEPDYDEQECDQPKDASIVDESELVPQLEANEDCLFLSNSLRPHANAVFSNRVAILGIPGAGKSNTVAVFAEELGRFGTPLVIFDTENEYGPLCTGRYFKRPFIADKYSVNLETAFSLGEQIMEERLQVVLNLDSYDDDDLAALIMIDVIRGIQKWEEALSNDDRIPCAIILDEAAVWLPQNPKDSMLSKTEDDEGRTTLEKLQQIFFSVVVRRGRKRGIGFILASQRSAEIDKRAIASAQWKFLQEQNMPNDLKVYHEFGVEKEIVQALGPGQAFVIGPGVKGVHQLRKRNSPDNAKTPGLESLRKRRYTEGLAARSAQVIEPVVTMRLPEMEDLPAKQVVQYEPVKAPARHTSEDDRKIKKALQYREQGYGSVRKLESVSGWSNGECRRILRLIKEKGL